MYLHSATCCYYWILTMFILMSNFVHSLYLAFHRNLQIFLLISAKRQISKINKSFVHITRHRFMQASDEYEKSAASRCLTFLRLLTTFPTQFSLTTCLIIKRHQTKWKIGFNKLLRASSRKCSGLASMQRSWQWMWEENVKNIRNVHTLHFWVMSFFRNMKNERKTCVRFRTAHTWERKSL